MYMLSKYCVVSVVSSIGRHSPRSEQGERVEGVKPTGADDDDRQGPAFDNTINSRAVVKRLSRGMDVPLSLAGCPHSLLPIKPHDGEEFAECPSGCGLLLHVVRIFLFYCEGHSGVR